MANEIKLAGLMVLALGQVGKWYLVPDLEATTSPLTAPATAAGWGSFGVGMVVVGVGAGACGAGWVTTRFLLFSRLL